nr:ribonuclease H-like domain-containing protein [Tanacetum cinerariifolium]
MIRLMGLLCITYFKKLIPVKQGGSLVASYYHRLNSLCREFEAMTKLPKCTCEVKCSCDASKELLLHEQLMKLMQYLMGIDDCYQPIRSALLTRDPIPEVKDAYNIMSREESHIGVPKPFGPYKVPLREGFKYLLTIVDDYSRAVWILRKVCIKKDDTLQLTLMIKTGLRAIKIAMNNEIEALNENNTWCECDLPSGRKPIGSKWIWNTKYKVSGEIEKYKAKLVAKGFSQREGFDSDETFSPVVKMFTVKRLIIIIVCNS